MRNAYKTLIAKSEGRDHSETLDVDRRIILKWILVEYGLSVWIGLSWLRIWFSEHSNEPSCSINDGEFLDYLSVV
jgi:hypothetical protein